MSNRRVIVIVRDRWDDASGNRITEAKVADGHTGKVLDERAWETIWPHTTEILARELGIPDLRCVASDPVNPDPSAWSACEYTGHTERDGWDK